MNLAAIAKNLVPVVVLLIISMLKGALLINKLLLLSLLLDGNISVLKELLLLPINKSSNTGVSNYKVQNYNLFLKLLSARIPHITIRKRITG